MGWIRASGLDLNVMGMSQLDYIDACAISTQANETDGCEPIELWVHDYEVDTSATGVPH